MEGGCGKITTHFSLLAYELPPLFLSEHEQPKNLQYVKISSVFTEENNCHYDFVFNRSIVNSLIVKKAIGFQL